MSKPQFEKLGVTQKAIVFNEEGKILTIRRSASAPRNPMRWDLPGGILDLGEAAKEGITREIKEETGLEVKDVKVADVISKYDEKNEFWVTIFYTSTAATNKIKLSYEHVQYKWVSMDEFVELDASEKLKQFVNSFKQNTNK